MVTAKFLEAVTQGFPSEKIVGSISGIFEGGLCFLNDLGFLYVTGGLRGRKKCSAMSCLLRTYDGKSELCSPAGAGVNQLWNSTQP